MAHSGAKIPMKATTLSPSNGLSKSMFVTLYAASAKAKTIKTILRVLFMFY